MTRIALYKPSTTLVVLTKDRKVTAYRIGSQGTDNATVVESGGDGAGDTIFSGTREEAAAVLRSLRDDHAAGGAPHGRWPGSARAGGLATYALAGVSTFALAAVLTLATLNVPGLRPVAPTVPVASSALPQSPTRLAAAEPAKAHPPGSSYAPPPATGEADGSAPASVPDPEDSDAAAAQMGGNDLQAGSTSPHGATGAALADARNAARAPGRAPDASRMPPLPTATPAATAPQSPTTAAAVPPALAAARPGSFTVVAQSGTGHGQAAPHPVPVAPVTPDAGKASASPAPTSPVDPASAERARAAALATGAPMPPKPPGQAASTAKPADEAAARPATQAMAALEAVAKDVADKAHVDQAAARDAVKQNGVDASAEDIAKLQSVVQVLKEGRKIPEEVVRGFPPDLAKALAEKGVVETPDEAAARLAGATGEKGYAVIHLTPDVLARYHDKDGMQTIPSTNAWVTTGNNVVVPLPGGGEIKRPEDLAAFGLDG